MRVLIAISFALTTSLLGQTPAPAISSGKHPFTFEDMMKLKRVGAPVPSPDGLWVVFDAEDVDLEANVKISHLWIVPAQGGESRRLNPTPNHEERPRFSPDGKRLIWTSKATDPTQIWMCDFDTNAGGLIGQPHQLTNISTGAEGAIWSPDGKNIVFVSAVYPDCKDDPCNKQRDDELKNSKVKAKTFTRLFYRHWNAFTEFKRSHLFVVSADATADRNTDSQSVRPAELNSAESDKTQTAESISAGRTGQSPVFRQPRDLTPGDHDVPPFHLGGQDMYAISPDGQEVAYTSNINEVEATSTNNEIFIVPMAGGAAKKISTSPGNDSTPLYSPDGKYIAWRSQARAGFEADKWRLFVQDRQSGKTRDLTEKFDRSVGSYTWTITPAPYDKPIRPIIFSAEDHGEAPLFYNDVEGDEPPIRYGGLHADDLIFAKSSAEIGSLYFANMSIQAPNEIWRMDFPSPKGKVGSEPVTHMNDALLSQIDMQPLESFTFKGANNDDVQGLMVKPPGFDPAKKYPLKFLIHGGPQGAWGNSWTYRWNAELFAAPSSPQSVGRESVERKSGTSPDGSTESSPTKANSSLANGATDGYVVVMINFHGSTGYGQKFTDSISGDWGGKPYVDLTKGLDYVEKTYPFIDKNREAALGASYGGYMANWLLGHTDRFKCIVSHDGIFNTESGYGTTEELWFPEWEFKGPPWKQRELYRKFSPHLFAEKFKTPTLVIHGQNDYRLDVSEGFQLFSTLQRLKVPSKMLYFPDEGHWVLKPQNSQLWYKTVNDWVDQWCGK
ncbi:MAG: S9 family peptidase [Verrucomicrobia bacterium]|nr:MAG: S9 family peptidase [Verrucomicrobiota bacterium]